MTLSEALYTYLSTYSGLVALAGTNTYHGRIPQRIDTPFVSWWKISEPQVHVMGTDDGPYQPRMQFNCYGNTPDELVPYGRFQKAYKNFFDEPQLFTGAGREKAPPSDLDVVKIGLLGPLDGSVMVPQGLQMLQGATLAMEEANEMVEKAEVDESDS